MQEAMGAEREKNKIIRGISVLTMALFSYEKNKNIKMKPFWSLSA